MIGPHERKAQTDSACQNWNTGTIVGHADDDALAILYGEHLNRSAVGRRVLHRIFKEIPQHDPHFLRIDVDPNPGTVGHQTNARRCVPKGLRDLTQSLPNSSRVAVGTVTSSSPAPRRATPSLSPRRGRSSRFRTVCATNTTAAISSNRAAASLLGGKNQLSLLP
jgi:hypothetical protein